MAGYFGNLPFPVRLEFWFDEDEYEPRKVPSEFFIRWLKEKPNRMDTLIVVEGQMLMDFSKKCLCPNSEEVCLVEDEKGRKMCEIYLVNDKTYLCLVAQHFELIFSGKLIEKMSKILSSTKSTICITCQHVSYYKNKSVPNVPSFLRMLVTKNGKNVCNLKEPLLEQPNIVYGVTAGVLSYAEFKELPSVLYILYIDNFALDSLSAEPLLKLFAAMNCTIHDVNFTGNKFYDSNNFYM